MSVDVRIRPARETDGSECGVIDAEARRALVDQRGGEAWLVEHEPLQHVAGWWTDSFVAEIDGVIVGFLVGRVESTGRGPVYVVDRVYVLAGARELGCGDDLLDAAMNRAVAGECTYLEATALPGDRDTKNLYERAGVTARSITVSKRLSGPSSSANASR